MRNILLTLIIIFVQPTISKSQKSIETEYQICIKALDYIKAKDIEGLKGLIHKASFKNTTDEKFAKGVDELYDLVVGIENPTMDMIFVMTSVSQRDGQNVNIYSLAFPFVPISRRDDERGVQLVFMFSKEIKKNKIIGWKVRDFGAPLLRQEEEDKKNIPTLEKFDFKSKNIIEFRIVYKERTATEKHFEISGDSTKLDSLNIKTKLDEILSIINESKIKKKDYRSVRWLRDQPNLELDALQFSFSNYDLKLYGTFEIVNIDSEDPEINKDYGGYIVVHHGPFRYFISTKDNVALVDKIVELRKTTLK